MPRIFACRKCGTYLMPRDTRPNERPRGLHAGAHKSMKIEKEPMPMNFADFRNRLLACRHCASSKVEAKPFLWGEQTAKIVQVSQEPTQKVIECGIPFSQSTSQPIGSGRDLLEWYKIPRAVFLNPQLFYITGMAHCYTGGNRRLLQRCAKKWLRLELSFLDPELYIIVGSRSANFFFPKRDFTQLVFQDLWLRNRRAFVLPHPSPANKNWFKCNPEFESERVQTISKAVQEALSNQ